MKASEKQRRRAWRAQRIAQEIARLEEYVKLVHEHRDMILANDALYAMSVRECSCGDCYTGERKFTAGIMLECWEKEPYFTLNDGFKICKWGGSVLSGTCVGCAFNPETGEFRNFKCEVNQPTMIRKVLPYERKLRQQLEDGLQPVDFDVFKEKIALKR